MLTIIYAVKGQIYLVETRINVSLYSSPHIPDLHSKANSLGDLRTSEFAHI